MIGCLEREVRDCYLKSYGVFYFSNVWWDHIPDANCSGVKREHCSVDAGSLGGESKALATALLRF